MQLVCGGIGKLGTRNEEKMNLMCAFPRKDSFVLFHLGSCHLHRKQWCTWRGGIAKGRGAVPHVVCGVSTRVIEKCIEEKSMDGMWLCMIIALRCAMPAWWSCYAKGIFCWCSKWIGHCSRRNGKYYWFDCMSPRQGVLCLLWVMLVILAVGPNALLLDEPEDVFVSQD